MSTRTGAAALLLAMTGLAAACGGGREVLSLDDFGERMCELFEEDTSEFDDLEADIDEQRADGIDDNEELDELIGNIERIRGLSRDLVGQIPQPEGDDGAEWIERIEEGSRETEERYTEAVDALKDLDGDDIDEDDFNDAMDTYDAADEPLSEAFDDAPDDVQEKLGEGCD